MKCLERKKLYKCKCRRWSHILEIQLFSSQNAKRKGSGVQSSDSDLERSGQTAGKKQIKTKQTKTKKMRMLPYRDASKQAAKT